MTLIANTRKPLGHSQAMERLCTCIWQVLAKYLGLHWVGGHFLKMCSKEFSKCYFFQLKAINQESAYPNDKLM